MNMNFRLTLRVLCVAMRITDLLKAILIITDQLITKRSCAIARIWIIIMRLMVMIARF